MITLTRPDGSYIRIDPAAITMIEPNNGLYAKGAKSVILIDGKHQAVVETAEQIEALR